MKRRAFPIIQTPHEGLSLVELVIVLGISTLLLGVAFTWFNSRGGVNFYDQARQIESAIKEVETESQTNLVNGGAVAACGYANRQAPDLSVCPIGQGDEAFASAVAISGNVDPKQPEKIKVYYLKKKAPITPGNPVVKIESYSSREIILPVDIRFDGYYTVTDPSGRGCSVTAPDSVLTPRDTSSPNASGKWSAIVFRKQPDTLYAFKGPGSAPGFYGSDTPPFSYNAAILVGSEDDVNGGNYINYGGNDGGNTLPATPCAVVWQFKSIEKISGTTPRYTAEIIYNLANQTIRLQTR